MPDLASDPLGPAGSTRPSTSSQASRSTVQRHDGGLPGVRRPTALGISTVLVLAMAIGNLAQHLESRASRAALAGLPGILAPVSGAVTERWTADVSVGPDVFASAGLLIGVDMVRTAASDVVALDADNGSVAWRTPLTGTRERAALQGCRPPVSRSAGLVAGSSDVTGPAAGTDSASIVCLVTHRPAARLDNHPAVHGVLLDAHTGEVRDGTVPVRRGPLPEAHRVIPLIDDGSLRDVTVQTTPEGAVVARDSSTASVRWTLPGPFRHPPAVLRTKVVVVGADEILCVDGRTGGVLWSLPARPRGAGVLTDGQVVLVAHGGMRGAVLSAVDVGTGYVEWTSEIPEDLRLFVVDGRLYGTSADRLVALG